MSAFMLGPHRVDQYGFIVSLKSRSVSPSVLFLFFSKILLAIWGPLRFHMNFKMGFSISAKNSIEIFMVIVLTLETSLGSTDILTVLSVPIHERGKCCHLFISSFISFSTLYSFHCTNLSSPWLS